jgi:hypothetical protein
MEYYDLSSFKVLKAIRALGDDISYIACVNRLGLDKADALVSNDTKIAIAGFAKDGKGIIEIWDKPAHLGPFM